jgi:hypothetical protein
MIERPTPPPQKRKASVSCASSPSKRARAISSSIKVSHKVPSPIAAIGNPKIPVVPQNPQACLGEGGIAEELLLNVIQHLRHDRDALAKLCRVDIRCKRIAEELLYNTLGSGYGSAPSRWYVSVALNTVLAKNVRDISLMFREPTALSEDQSSLRPTRNQLVRVLQNISDVRYVRIHEVQNLDARTDGLSNKLGWLQLFKDAAIGHAGGLSNRFAHLKELHIRAATLSLAQLSAVFCLPSLVSLRLERIYQTTRAETWNVPQGSCTVQKLFLASVFMDIEAVEQVLSSMKAVKNVSYHPTTIDWEPYNQNSPKSQLPSQSWTQLGDALRKHKESLEEVETYEHADRELLESAYPEGREVGTLGSFKDFPKLRSVSAPIQAFLDIKTGEEDISLYLPPQLESFETCLRVEDENIMTCYPSALASLEKVLCPGPKSLLTVSFDGDLPFKQLFLWQPIKKLVDAGIQVHTLDGRGGDEVTLDDLRDLEADENEDEEEEETDEDESDEEDEEESADEEDSWNEGGEPVVEVGDSAARIGQQTIAENSNDAEMIDQPENDTGAPPDTRTFHMKGGTRVSIEGQTEPEITLTKSDGTRTIASGPDSFAAAVAADAEMWPELLKSSVQARASG